MGLFINIATWFVLVGGILCISGLLYKVFENVLKSFWKEHVVAEFPYCNEGSCENCELLRRFKL